MISQDPYIKIKGVGRIKRAPDTIVLSLDIEEKDACYSDAVEGAAKQLRIMQGNLATVGFKKQDLKTNDFTINPDYEDFRDENGNYTRHFLGYKVNQSLSLSFPLDMETLNKVMSVLAMCVVNPEVRIGFTISDEDGIKKELLKSATQDAIEKANILCEASNVKLGRLLSIDYSWKELCFESTEKYEVFEAHSAEFDMQPDDIKISDTVEFIWELK
ncbi:MAG: SIMPL domain-containing protein [Selenomonas sp.]|nr:SIMPL domain-containing protein [Selenomonas sp.]